MRKQFHLSMPGSLSDVEQEIHQTEHSLSRRAFGQGTLGSLLAYTLLETLAAGDAFGENIKPIASEWLGGVNDLGKSLKDGAISQQQWQTKVEELLEKVELKDLMASLDMQKLMATVAFRERGEKSVRPKLPALPEVKGLPTRYVFGHQVFALKKGRSVPPHGHYNMATLFLVMNGKFHGRHYDRLEEDDKSMIVKPTIDRAFAPGEYSTVTDFKDNVHWFKATSETGFIFNIHLLRVDPAVTRGGRVYIDPDGEPLDGGKIRTEDFARRIHEEVRVTASMKGAKIIGVGGVLGVLGVALGAFGAHGLEETLQRNDAVETWDTASHYHMVAALAVISCGLAASHFRCRGAAIAAIFLTLGAVCFSGSLYGYSLTQWKPLVFVTPVGGLLMMMGFAALAWTAFSCAGEETDSPTNEPRRQADADKSYSN